MDVYELVPQNVLTKARILKDDGKFKEALDLLLKNSFRFKFSTSHYRISMPNERQNKIEEQTKKENKNKLGVSLLSLE